jgi:tetratricopeptide (TPR) repeat protein
MAVCLCLLTASTDARPAASPGAAAPPQENASPGKSGPLPFQRKPAPKKTPSKAKSGNDSSTPPAPSPSASPASAASPAKAAAASPAPSATPSQDPASPAFMEKYEAAFVKYTAKDYAGAKATLDEADAIQRNQPAAIDLRNKIFSYYYQAAYLKYLEKDYTASQSVLDEADRVQINQPDSLNLRGLIFSRQSNFDKAEEMFKKAVEADPSFWAAKFNMAELPFTYRNFPAARSRYEKLLSETDSARQPREAELTQFKVFLTLLLEGKEEGARAFMDHFKFTGATPARYYCQAALEFRNGNGAKALEWLAQARKEFPAQIEAIFADSFYRVGWLTDPNKKATSAPTTAIAAASPAPSASPAVVAAATPAPSASPMLMAAASPAPSPVAAKVVPAESPQPTAAPTVIVAAATPKPPAVAVVPAASPQPSASPAAVAAVTPGPKPAASASPGISFPPTVIVSASPTRAPASSPLPTAPAMASTTPPVLAQASPMATATPAPAASTGGTRPAFAQTTPALPSMEARPTAAVAAASATPAPADKTPGQPAPQKAAGNAQMVRSLIIGATILYFLGINLFMFRQAAAIKARRRRPALHYAGRKKASQEMEVPR